MISQIHCFVQSKKEIDEKIVSAPYIDQTARWVNGCESISSVMLLQAVGDPH